MTAVFHNRRWVRQKFLQLSLLKGIPTASPCPIIALLFFFQENLAYYPQTGREIQSTPRDHGLAYEALTLTTPDGERLDAWFVPKPLVRGAVLVLHGNASNISHRMDMIAMFHRLGYSVLIFDYRGYGRSTGQPSEEGLYQDAQT